MGLRRKLTAVLGSQGTASNKLDKISELVLAKKPKEDKLLGTIEIWKMDLVEGVTSDYQFEVFSDLSLPTSAVDALISAMKQYRQEVSICDCEICKAINEKEGV